MSEEINTLRKIEIWSLVPRDSSMSILSSKWVYKHKMNDEGRIVQHKAHLVAVGLNQKNRVDFMETFAPVVKPATTCLILLIAVTRCWKLCQLNVSNAFLHGVFDEDVYMLQPLGFKGNRHKDYICKLQKVIYGLRQSPRAWFRRLRDFLVSIKFNESLSDQSLFIFLKTMSRRIFWSTLMTSISRPLPTNSWQWSL